MTRRPLGILHTESSIGWGGQEIRILTEAQGMLRRGHRITLLTPPEALILPAAQKMGLPVVALPIGKKSLGALAVLRRWLAANGRDFDVINMHSSTDSWLSALACRTLRDMPPLIRTRHVSTPVHNTLPTRWLYLRATAHIVTAGEALRQQLHRDNRFPLKHMTSVPTGIDLARFQPRDQAAARRKLGLADLPTLGIVATLRDWKGHAYLLEAFGQLRARFPEWQLLVVGDGPMREILEQQTRDRRLDDRVRLVGNRDDVELWLNALDLFVLPSYGEEGVPQGIMQAMACGLAVVSTPVGAIREAVVDGETGVLVEPRNSDALAQGLARLMSDAAQRRQMGEAGMRRAQARFGIDGMLDRMEAVFYRFARREAA
ncbi:MAG: glycosyltransferase family 4 protein [Pseudomonadota bacterium]